MNVIDPKSEYKCTCTRLVQVQNVYKIFIFYPILMHFFSILKFPTLSLASWNFQILETFGALYKDEIPLIGLVGLWCLTSLSTIFSYIVTVSFIVGGNQRKPWTCRKLLDKLYHIMLYQVYLTMNGVRTHNFSGDRHGLHMTCSCKSNYHTIMTTAVPRYLWNN